MGNHHLDRRADALGAAFDYAALPADVAKEAQSIVADAHELYVRTVEAQAQIGGRLAAIRKELGRGLFLKWVKAEFFGGRSTAYNLIHVAENLATEVLPTVGTLPARTVYQLAAPTTPASVRDELVGRLKTGEKIKASEIEATVKEARRLARVESKLPATTPRRKPAPLGGEEDVATAIRLVKDHLADEDLRRLGGLLANPGTEWLFVAVLRGTYTGPCEALRELCRALMPRERVDAFA